jgi:hypothetical protein
MFRDREGRDMDERAFASATLLAGEIRGRHVGCLELVLHLMKQRLR